MKYAVVNVAQHGIVGRSSIIIMNNEIIHKIVTETV